MTTTGTDFGFVDPCTAFADFAALYKSTINSGRSDLLALAPALPVWGSSVPCGKVEDAERSRKNTLVPFT